MENLDRNGRQTLDQHNTVVDLKLYIEAITSACRYSMQQLLPSSKAIELVATIHPATTVMFLPARLSLTYRRDVGLVADKIRVNRSTTLRIRQY
jgi:hypothetical protein